MHEPRPRRRVANRTPHRKPDRQLPVTHHRGSAPVQPRRYAFALLDAFSMMSLISAVEPLRAANRLLDKPIYAWSLLSQDGAPVRASNGIEVTVDGSVADAPAADILFVCAGLRAEKRPPRAFTAVLRRAARRGEALGAISGGTFALARAGLLDGYRCTVHWEYRPAFVEAFPDIECTSALFEMDRDRYTCSGGIASMDLMLSLIARDGGPTLSDAVANQFQVERIRSPRDIQRSGSIGYLDGTPPALRRAIGMMLAEIEEPLAIPVIAKAVGLTTRQLERLFAQNIGETPVRYYLGLRLERARELLLHSDAAILDVAIATGFPTSSYFAQCHKARYGVTPTATRRSAG